MTIKGFPVELEREIYSSLQFRKGDEIEYPWVEFGFDGEHPTVTRVLWDINTDPPTAFVDLETIDLEGDRSDWEEDLQKYWDKINWRPYEVGIAGGVHGPQTSDNLTPP